MTDFRQVTQKGKVWFVGAGPGDPELITVKGLHILEQAGAILYAGSLVSQATTLYAPKGCIIHDSKGMTLEEITCWLITQAQQHKIVVRLQTGDPGLYGALIEMVQPLNQAKIDWSVIPGVSSAMASAAVAGETLTLPEVTQTVIFTRMEGRTPMPEGEDLESLAIHKTTLCLFLSITLLADVQKALLNVGWDEESSILVVQKASWPNEEKIVRGTIKNIREKCRAEKINSQAMIIASPTLGAQHWPEISHSKLYDANFTHRFRKANKK
ncbi:MAG: precorrin-4 C(11)-methyltransferase [Methylococcaceae bacterium]|nr:precorrin-4 C(11)-methyltransferase [Methylococcaceae bacterium]